MSTTTCRQCFLSQHATESDTAFSQAEHTYIYTYYIPFFSFVLFFTKDIRLWYASSVKEIKNYLLLTPSNEKYNYLYSYLFLLVAFLLWDVSLFCFVWCFKALPWLQVFDVIVKFLLSGTFVCVSFVLFFVTAISSGLYQEVKLAVFLYHMSDTNCFKQKSDIICKPVCSFLFFSLFTQLVLEWHFSQLHLQ